MEDTVSYTYDANGNRATMVSKVNEHIYATTTYSYNLANMVVSMTNDPSNESAQTFAYTYYLDGNQRTKTEGTKVTTYAYDYAGRLVSEVTTDNGTPSVGYTYTYDDFGNRLTMTTDGVTTSYTYDLNNRLLQTTAGNNTTTYSYNANGDMLTEIKKESGVVKEHAIYTYDLFFGQLVSIGSMNNSIGGSYDYYVSGLRRKSGNTYFIYDGENIIAECSNTGAITRRYYRGINLIGYNENPNNNHLYMQNAHGDVVGIVSFKFIYEENYVHCGKITKTYDYDAFGNEVFPDPDDNNPFRYCGEYYDKGTNRLYLRARDYDSATGRFTSEDTHWNAKNTIYGDNPLKIGDKLVPNQSAFMQSLNRYTYCMSNPIMYVDYSGFSAKEKSKSVAVNIDDKWYIGLKNDDGTYSLYDNDRFRDENEFHEQIFVVEPAAISYEIDLSNIEDSLDDNLPFSWGGSFTLITGGWEWENIDLSLLDLLRFTAAISVDRKGEVDVNFGISVWNPSIKFNLWGIDFTFGFNLGISFSCKTRQASAGGFYLSW